jgi:hypothetical protein
MARDRRPEQSGIIPQMLGNGPHSPRAAQLQSATNEADRQLIALARRRSPTVAWWWGVRKTEGTTGAFCYICRTVIVAGALNLGITSEQSAAIDQHRAEHWQDTRQANIEEFGF